MSQSFRLGVFILIGLAILAAGVFLIGGMESRFQANYRLKAQFQNVAGLVEGADVRVGGVHKGTVRNIELPARADGKVTVVMDLSRQTRNLLKQDSLASIKSEGLLGDKYVEISFGSPEAAPLNGGETIPSEPPVDIANLIAKTDQILDTAKSTLDNFEGVSGNVNAITSKINRGQGAAGALVNDKSMYKEATAAVTALHEDAEALKHNFFLKGFFNKRGYEDASELSKHQIAQLPSGAPQKTFTFDPVRIFDKPDSAKLRNPKLLNEAGEYLQLGNFGLAVIAASAGMKGDSEKDRELSEARAYVARNYLVTNFRINDQRLKTIALGKTREPPKLEIYVYP
jgi:phospholipid/cholesterol/gamma-HCH transport system substrate-binding protein